MFQSQLIYIGQSRREIRQERLPKVLYTYLMALVQKFTDHPNSVDETYRQHMAVALGFAVTLARASLDAVVHAFFPWLCSGAASTKVKKLHQEMTTGSRAAQAVVRGEVVDDQPPLVVNGS